MHKRFSKSDGLDTAAEDELPPEQPVAQKPLLGLYLVGWGVALIVCGISAAVHMREYAGHTYCFLSPAPALGAVVVPVAVLLLFLVTFLLLVHCAIKNLDNNGQLSEGTQATENVDLDLLDSNAGIGERTSLQSVSAPTASSEVEDPEHTPVAQMKAHIVVLVLFILTWILASLAIAGPFSFPYQKAIFSTLYGFSAAGLGSFVLFFYCVARSDVRVQWHLIHCWCRRKRRARCCRTRSISDTNPAVPPTQSVPPTTAQRVCSVAVSSSNSVSSSANTNKSHGSLSKNGVMNGMVHTVARTSGKPNVNVVVLHRQQYSAPEPSGASGAEMFYNPHQSTVARKFFRKQRRHMKHNNLGTRRCGDGGGGTSDCDSNTRAESAVFLSSDMENTSSNIAPSVYGVCAKVDYSQPVAQIKKMRNPNAPSESSDEYGHGERLGPPMERLVIGAEETSKPTLFTQNLDHPASDINGAHIGNRSSIGPVIEVDEPAASSVADLSEVDSEIQSGIGVKSLSETSDHELACSENISGGESLICRTSSGALSTSYDTENYKTEGSSWKDGSELGSEMAYAGTNSDNGVLDSFESLNSLSVSDILKDSDVGCNTKEKILINPETKSAKNSPRSKRHHNHLSIDAVVHDLFMNSSVTEVSEEAGTLQNAKLSTLCCNGETNTDAEDQLINKKETSV